ncbi:hypothetical protein SKAU_G00094140 [Synaphobranchus kaupii]|uniref:Uncharacterized protein n=1 Tax=Synaphobranchus kaupii TaxID=118154 RepID=A0A9Q1FXA9_SYNKA|nr:hypothetical protein SKAU_G00094140 [Synaphobranchus kaupii]
MVQGFLKDFEKTFIALKGLVEKETPSPTDNPNATHTDTAPALSSPTEEEQDSEESNSPNGEQAEPHKSSLTQIKEHFTQLEIEQVQLKEMFLKQQTEKDSIQLLLKQITKIKKEQEGTLAAYQKELQQDRECHRKELAALREQVRELQQDRESHRNELIALREELKDRDRTVERQQLHPLTDQGLLTVVNSTQASLDIQTQPGPSTPNSSQNELPIQHAPPEPTSQTAHSDDEHTMPEATENAHIVLLIDSNGKFINEKKLFPRHRVTKLWCPTTQKALELLSESCLGSPSHILIHTGTNDLRAQQERVATSIRAVTEKASHTFPNSKIVISTLLPRKDFHPHTIQKVNASISRDCALRPNVHLAHHPALSVDDLYDQVHLYKEAVPVLAKTLKDVALNRNSTTSHRSNGQGRTQTPRRTPRPSNNTPSRADQPRPEHHRLYHHHHYPPHPPRQTRPQEHTRLIQPDPAAARPGPVPPPSPAAPHQQHQLQSGGPTPVKMTRPVKRTHKGHKKYRRTEEDQESDTGGDCTDSSRRKRKMWSREEIQAVEQKLMYNIKTGRVPGKAQCLECIAASPEALKGRTWDAVKYYVKNRIDTWKRQSTKN